MNPTIIPCYTVITMYTHIQVHHSYVYIHMVIYTQLLLQASRMLTVPHSRYIGYYDDYVEVKGPDGWGLLCSKVLTDVAASVVCKENRFLFKRGMRVGNHVSYSGPRYAGFIFCDPEDEGMDKCLKYLTKVNSCPSGEVLLDCTHG